MNPYLKLGIKSFSVFVGAVGATSLFTKATGQINLYDWLAVLWPALVALGSYWGGIADSTPAPWVTPDAVRKVADVLEIEQTPLPKNGGTKL